uniref:Uncharacterized protein n=1 Tax=Candidatus Kentrum sp. MB TaxID=2138164 RepID=A0A450XPB2_9GAMM|nr:MAG: hypothetical protein BECKMB1821G_GA0114241_10786 [Candidatus Kentron sp. MB]VFK34635.1 MAG: hypothetical protein BECKMB1821I_GA0114274_10786 [Candidatus Kentron sp. MB]VFK76836.1 MAG: hypothetical protein BECKMB1821H_GA0114242_10786 [Candidatus Kentron sp. MB]
MDRPRRLETPDQRPYNRGMPAWQSGDGRLALAAFGDGTIRWRRLRNGASLLSLFVTNDKEAGKRQWVLRTPGGYYDASPGGDALIGWHVNNGKEALADFYPAVQLRERFYRPRVVAEVLTELDEARAPAKAGEKPGTGILGMENGLPWTLERRSPVSGSRFRDQ